MAEEKKKQEETESLVYSASGTGFFVSKNGHVITNNHVTNFCDVITIHYEGIVYEGQEA